MFGSPHDLTEVKGEHREERGIIKDKIIAGVNHLFGKAGILECNGLESEVGTFVHQLFGGRPTLGNAICGPTCGG